MRSTLDFVVESSADTRRRINVGLTLVQRPRRWTKVKPTMIWRIVSAGRVQGVPIILRLCKDAIQLSVNNDGIMSMIAPQFITV